MSQDRDLALRVCKLLKDALPAPVPLHEPDLAGNEWTYIKECLDTNWVSTAGKFVERFEDMVRQFTGSAHAIGVINGTSALHTALLLTGVKPGDEVLIPALTFVATANAVAYTGATPHFVDAKETSLGVDAARLDRYLEEITENRPDGCYNRKTNKRISALIGVHTFGHPFDLDAVQQVALKFGLKFIEDAAESLGSFYKDKHTGLCGDLSILSFNGNKIVTAGAGGCILTQNDELAARAKHKTTTAKVPHPWNFYHDEVGYNYRLPNLSAALGCAQMERLGGILAKKRALADWYRILFREVNGVRVMQEPADTKSNYWLNVLIIDEGERQNLDEILKCLTENQIMARPAWTPMHRLPMYEGCPRMDLNVTESLCKRILCLPSSARLIDRLQPTTQSGAVSN